jgi:hypothetical protein
VRSYASAPLVFDGLGTWSVAAAAVQQHSSGACLLQGTAMSAFTVRDHVSVHSSVTCLMLLARVLCHAGAAFATGRQRRRQTTLQLMARSGSSSSDEEFDDSHSQEEEEDAQQQARQQEARPAKRARSGAVGAAGAAPAGSAQPAVVA